MLCYRDMTFCTEDTCLLRHSCERYFRPEDDEKARRWWGGDDYPLCTYAERPCCYENEGE